MLAALWLLYRREAERRQQTVDELAKLSALQEKIHTADETRGVRIILECLFQLRVAKGFREPEFFIKVHPMIN